jgi:CubicO group peptidase (beta-lactamase class C family)
MIAILALALALDSLPGLRVADTTFATQETRREDLWVESPSVVSHVAYATPDVHGLPDRYTLYMKVDGHTAMFRVPVTNYLGGASYARYEVHENGDSLTFVDTTRTFDTLVGKRDGGRIILHWPALDVPLTLRRPSPAQVAAFYPRPPGERYTYRTPEADGDGWRVARAQDVGIDEAAVAAIVQKIADTDPVPRMAPLIQSLLVARHGRLVLDEYFFGFDAERLHDLRSGSKTFTSAMAGAAMDHGAHFDMSTPIYALFGDPRPDRSRITVGHLLSHSSGLACDDNDDASPGNEDTMQSQTAQPDWYRFTLDLPVAHDPGTIYAYCSAGINLAAGVIRRMAGVWLPLFFQRTIAAPLGIHHWAMNLMPTGEGYGGGGLYLRPRDFLKLGQAYLDSGVWNGRRIVSAAWVHQSTSRQIATGTNTWDGYGWHLNVLNGHDEYEATGNGGQLLMVIPDLDLTIVFTAANYNRYPIWKNFRDVIAAQEIIPAVQTRR